MENVAKHENYIDTLNDYTKNERHTHTHTYTGTHSKPRHNYTNAHLTLEHMTYIQILIHHFNGFFLYGMSNI